MTWDTQSKPRVYFATHPFRKDQVIQWAWTFEQSGFKVVSDWHLLTPETFSPAEHWPMFVSDAAGADYVVLYTEAGDHLKGCLIECGACLAGGGTVLQIGSSENLQAGGGSDASFTQNPNWRLVADVQEAIEVIRKEAKLD